MSDSLRPLSSFERWMVKSNLKTIKETGEPVAERVALLRANGYPRVAAAVQAECVGGPKPVFLTTLETKRYARRGLAEGTAAIRAVSSERKPGKVDSRDGEERLGDLLCSLRIWAEAHEVDFDEAAAASLTNHKIETGRMAENWRDL